MTYLHPEKSRILKAAALVEFSGLAGLCLTELFIRKAYIRHPYGRLIGYTISLVGAAGTGLMCALTQRVPRSDPPARASTPVPDSSVSTPMESLYTAREALSSSEESSSLKGESFHTAREALSSAGESSLSKGESFHTARESTDEEATKSIFTTIKDVVTFAPDNAIDKLIDDVFDKYGEKLETKVKEAEDSAIAHADWFLRLVGLEESEDSTSPPQTAT